MVSPEFRESVLCSLFTTYYVLLTNYSNMTVRIPSSLLILFLFLIPPVPVVGTHPVAASDQAAFSKDRLLADVRWLSRREMKGRGFGTPELDAAADYIEQQFRAAGLSPGGDLEGSYFQTWTAAGGEPEAEATLKNVVGVIPGANPKCYKQSGRNGDRSQLGFDIVAPE